MGDNIVKESKPSLNQTEKESKKMQKCASEITLDMTWGELDYQMEQAKEAKRNKGRRRYI